MVVFIFSSAGCCPQPARVHLASHGKPGVMPAHLRPKDTSGNVRRV